MGIGWVHAVISVAYSVTMEFQTIHALGVFARISGQATSVTTAHSK